MEWVDDKNSEDTVVKFALIKNLQILMKLLHIDIIQNAFEKRRLNP